ncbi:MAG: glycosyltransferase [Ruminococcaceae bacterium]|nr:glycosyltransferase [Oscillospiraceae bacterium]
MNDTSRSDSTSVLVSIIVPVYNDEEHLRACLDSIAAQTCADWEAWLADDCSEDSSALIAQEYCGADERFHLIRLDEHGSAWTCRAKAIEACGGRYIMFADADDTLERSAVERVVRSMKAAPVDILHFGTNVIDRRGLTKEQLNDYSAYLQPPVGALHGSEVFDSFAERRFEGHLWNKAFDARYVKAVIADIGTEHLLPKAQDKVLYWALCLAKKDVTYRGIRARLYNYNYGYGVESSRRPSVAEDCIPFLAQAWSENIIAEITKRYADGENDRFTSVLKRSRYDLMRHSVRKLLELSDAQTEKGFSLAARYWDAPDDKIMMICAAAELTWDRKAEAARRLLSFGRTTLPLKNRVIGTYYECMRNGGIQRVIARLVDVWHELGYEVVLITDEPPSQEDYPLPEYVTRVVTGLRHDRCDARSYLERGMKLAELVRQNNIGCMVYHSYFSPVLPYDACVFRALDIPFVLYQHNSFSRYLKENDERFSSIAYTSTAADAVVCLSGVDKSWWSGLNANTHFVLNPLTFDMDKVVRSPRDGHDMLFVGRLCRNAKRPHHAVEIAARVIERFPDAKLYIVGDTEDERYADSLRKRIAELSLEDNILLCGFQTDVAPFYSKASVFLMCSSYEGAPMTLCEAMSYSLPVVMYKLPYLAAVDGNDGVITVPQEDISAAADAVCELFSDNSRLTAVGDRGNAFLKKLYGDDISRQWQAVFKSLESEHTVADAARADAAIRLADDHLFSVRNAKPHEPTLFQKTVSYYRQYGIKKTVKKIFDRIKE